ncbi:MAG: ATPase domain-containing protein [Myxococcota bacterium]
MQPEDRERLERLERLTSGSKELDQILGGGFPLHSLNILMGEPGSGKTILAERLAFANVSSDRPIVYLTTLSEPLDKIVRYLEQFDFFDADVLGEHIIYDSIGDDLAERGVAAVVPKLTEIITALSPQMIIIDSFKAIHDLSTSIPEMRRMLYEAAGLLTAYATTVFLLGEYNDTHLASFPEFAVADGIVELKRVKTTARDERYLRVLKLRGSAYLEGLHHFRITDRGLDVFPRLTSPEVLADYSIAIDRVPSGVEGVDRLLSGGLPRGTATLVAGPTGSGKTTLSAMFALAAARAGERTIYLNFQENPSQLARSFRTLGATDDDLTGIDFKYVSPVELQIDSILVDLFQRAAAGNVHRVVIDALGDLATAADDKQRFHAYLYALSQHFSSAGINTLMTLELTAQGGLRNEDARYSALCDTFLVLDVELQPTPTRTLRIVKARGTPHPLEPHAFAITGNGIELVGA